MHEKDARNHRTSNALCVIASVSLLAVGLFLFFYMHSIMFRSSVISKSSYFPATEGVFKIVVHNNTNRGVEINYLSNLGRPSKFYGLFEANEYRVLVCDRAQIGKMTTVYWRKLGERREAEQVVLLDCVPPTATDGVMILEMHETEGWSASFKR